MKKKKLSKKRTAYKQKSRKPSKVKESIAVYRTVETIKPYFQTNDIYIYNDDFLKTKCIRDESIDLIVTSPPYNVGIEYNSHKDTMSYEDYLSFTKEWIAKCYRLAKIDGRFCLNIPLDKNKGGQQSVCADITTIAKEVGWKYHSTIIWNEQNISRRTAWGSWLSASAPYVIAPVEVIVILYKEQWKKASGSKKSDITKDEFIKWTNGVWTFMGESKKRIGHPAPYPVELPKRCIKLFSFVDDTVLDPFLGSGTTLVSCALNNRKGVGIDIDKKYCELAKNRLLNETIFTQQEFYAPNNQEKNKMIKDMSLNNLYNSLLNDLYSIGIFDKKLNGLLSIKEKNDNDKTILVERKFINGSNTQVIAGFYFIQCLDSLCEEKHLKAFRILLENIVKIVSKGNYMEVEPIIIAPEFDKSVFNFISQYNKIQRRKPIQLHQYGD